MGLRYVHAEPGARGESWVELRLDENHRPPVYLATVRLHEGRATSPDAEHVLDVAAPILARLSCRDAADYLEKGSVLERARAAIARRTDRPDRFEEAELAFERGRELVAAALDPRERSVYKVHWKGEHALSFWFEERTAGQLYWASSRFRAEPRLRPRALEHGFSYVPWALAELEAVRVSLVRRPRAIDLGLPLEVTEKTDEDRSL
jgi:hypothetical protein